VPRLAPGRVDLRHGLGAVGLIQLVPLSLATARRFVADHHRHNEPPIGHKFSIGLEVDGHLVGVVIAGRPLARAWDDGRTIELLRVTTIGDRNACSRLYAAACRAAGAMGYTRAVTYTLDSEPGTSLRAAGFTIDGETDHWFANADWTQKGQARGTDRLRLFDPPQVPQGPKRRYVRVLTA
jgi:hypothetical protein